MIYAALLNGQSNVVSKSEMRSFSKSHTFDPSNVKQEFYPKITNLEAPLPGGSSYRSHLLELKRASRKKFPLKLEPSKSNNANSFLDDPKVLDTLSLKWRVLVISNGDTILDLVDYLRDSGAPLDNTLAVSNDDYLMCGINSKIYMHDLKSGSDVYTADIKVVRFENFAQDNGNIQTDFPFDPKIIYDPIADRFVLTFLTGRTPSNSGLVLAFSTTNNPTDPWHVYKLPGNPYENNLWSDYPAIALTKDELFYTINLLVPSNDWKTAFKETVIWQIDKNTGYNGGELKTKLWGDVQLDGRNLRNLAVVQGGDELKGPNMYFLSNRNFDIENDTTFLVEITNTIDNTASMVITPLIADQSYGLPPNGRQANSDPNDPEDGFDTNDARVLGAVLVDDEIQFVGNSVNPETGLAAIYHGIIDNVSTTPTLKANIIGSPDLDFGYPNIAFTGNSGCENSTIIAFDHTSPIDYAGISAVKFGLDDDGNQSYSDILRIKEGENYVDKISGSYERWGDYFGIQRKYNEPGVVYTAGFFGTKSPSLAGTFFTKLRDCDCAKLNVEELSLSSTNKCVGELKVALDNGLTPITYNWNQGESNDTIINTNLCDYQYLVEASDKHGCSDSALLSSSSYPQEAATNGVGPNPTSGEVNIYFTVDRKTTVSVYLYSIDGKLSYELLDQQTVDRGKNILNFSLAPLNSGTYILRLMDGDAEILSEKIVFNN